MQNTAKISLRLVKEKTTMTVFVCIDERGGMTFNSRRQSRDRFVTEDIIKSSGDSLLYISDFSEDLFENSDASVISVPTPLSHAKEGSFVFIENQPLAPYKEKIKSLIIYKWNRRYPFDSKIDIDPEKEGFTLTRVTEFEGNSHEKITKEEYKR